MAQITFYTKPGCLGGIRQKEILLASGHTLEERSVLSVPWTPETLRPFFGQLPIAQWFNQNAPAVTAGTVIPGALPEKETLDLLCKEPILIKRPLMQIGNTLIAGFDPQILSRIITLNNVPAEDLTACKMPVNSSCDQKN